MEQYLIRHALKNVWGNPEQDDQLIFKAQRIGSPFGSLNRFKLMNREIDLPIKGRRYHVFNIGQYNPTLIGLANKKPDWVTEKWINLAETIESNKIMVSVYTADGNCVPRYQTYLMFSNERNLFFVVEENSKVKMDYKVDQVYLRVYSNAYYATPEGNSAIMRCRGRTALNTNEILTYQGQVAQLRQQTGSVSCFVNGFLVDEISPVTVSIGDSMEYVYDQSVKRVVTFDVNSLNVFESELDGKRKYLLHYPGTGDKTIDFNDDIEFYVLNKNAQGRYKGYYYHRNTQESIRMVTHRDYSIVVDYFEYIANKLMEDTSATPIDIRNFKIMMLVRKSGTNRSLIFDNSRIFEMYKLTDDKIMQAMVDVQSSLDIWTAPKLENGPYTKLMRTPFAQDVTLQMVQDAYGYNSISKIVGDTPTKTTLVSGRQTALLPDAIYQDCTVYEYDAAGKLLGWYYHNTDRSYQSQSVDCRMIEVLSGQGTNRPDVIFGIDNIPVPTYDNYRVYMCWMENGVPNNQWRDVTGTTEYHIDNGILKWDNEQIEQFVMIRSDKKFLAYDLDLQMVNGNFFFTFTEEEDRGLGQGVQTYTLPVPTGEIDLFMYGSDGRAYSMIKDLDYVIQFPLVYILNKKFLRQPAQSTTQKVHVRMTGFCSSDLEFEQIDDYGFVRFGYLSDNDRFDLRDDKVLRITVGGRAFHRSDLKFSEDNDGVIVADPFNGSPYQVKDIIVPLKQLVNENTYTLRQKSIDIDKKVSDYMTIRKPEPDRGNLNVIPEKWQVVTPFICRIVSALQTNFITDEQIAAAVTNNDVMALCAQFESILSYDPINEELGFNYTYVKVVPHHETGYIDLPVARFRFLNRVVGLYCHGLVDLTKFFTFTV